jgi:hypothetical protein
MPPCIAAVLGREELIPGHSWKVAPVAIQQRSHRAIGSDNSLSGAQDHGASLSIQRQFEHG